ncbi:MAG: c-type cytochrome [Myxococcales bacterium]|nr:c-type cytochrome [Myxococcales bacterium]
MTGSTVELARWGERTVAFVADEDARAIVVVDVDSQKTLSVTRTEGRPAQVLLLPDGRLAVALRDAGKLGIFERAANATYALEARCGVPAPADPVGLALEPRSARLLVASAWGHALTSFDAGTLERQDTIELAREPRSVVVSADGTTAFVAHAVGGRLSVVDLPSRKVQRVALTSLHDHDLWTIRERVVDRLGGGAVALPNKDLLAELLKDELADLNGRSRGGFGARTSCQGFALARTELPGGRIFAPQVFVDPGNREERTAGYGAGLQHTEVPSIAVLDDATGVPLAVSLRLGQDVHIQGHVTDLPEPCILPRAAVVDARSQQLLVSCLGIDTVIAYDAKSGDPVHAETRRWRVPAGPTGLAIDPVRKRAVVWSQFDRALSIIPLDASGLETEEGKDDAAVARIDLGRGTNDGGTHDGGMRGGSELTVELALGRSLFHASGDGRISNDGRACASCHPDGRDDGLVWATPNGPRRTKQLGGMLRGTAPFSWDGSAPDVHTHVVETFRRLAGKGGLRSLELRALIAYVESLDAPPIAAVSTDPKLARGAQIFASREAGCAGCHDGNARTDTRRHDITSRVTADRDAEFDTPSLRFVAGRAPYFHDGRYATLGALLAGTDGKMGHTAHLDEEQRAALEAYLSSL